MDSSPKGTYNLVPRVLTTTYLPPHDCIMSTCNWLAFMAVSIIPWLPDHGFFVCQFPVFTSSFQQQHPLVKMGSQSNHGICLTT